MSVGSLINSNRPTGSDEDQVCTLKHLPECLLRLKSSLLAKKGISSTTQPSGELSADLDLVE